jgi:hypothetical protein
VKTWETAGQGDRSRKEWHEKTGYKRTRQEVKEHERKIQMRGNDRT